MLVTTHNTTRRHNPEDHNRQYIVSVLGSHMEIKIRRNKSVTRCVTQSFRCLKVESRNHAVNFLCCGSSGLFRTGTKLAS
jgi:hypothetical protein